MAKPLLPPFRIYVAWSAHFEQGQRYAELIYYHFTRNKRNPMSRGLGIPVQFQVLNEEEKAPLLPLRQSENSVTLVLIDSHLVVCENCVEYLNALDMTASNTDQNHLIIPLAVEDSAINMESTIVNSGLVPLYAKNKFEKESFLLLKITHAVYQTLLSRSDKFAPVRLFLSYDHTQSYSLVNSLRSYIGKNFNISVTDARDNPLETLLSQTETRGNLVLLAIQTDDYSTQIERQREILIAKENDCPIILLNALNKGEDRLYPYLGNIPSFRSSTDQLKMEGDADQSLDEKINYLLDRIILSTLQEALRVRYHKKFTHYWMQVLGFGEEKKKKAIIRCRPPELLTLSHINEIQPHPELLIYPDPPLGKIESGVLKRHFTKEEPSWSFITPTSLTLFQKKVNSEVLKKLKVGVSISEHNGLNLLHLQDAMVEMARYLLNCGITLAYGGDLNYRPSKKGAFNFLESLIKLLQAYVGDSLRRPKLINYSAFPYSGFIDVKTRAKYNKTVKFIVVPPPAYLEIKEPAYLDFINATNENIFYAKAQSLSEMRRRMTKDIDARIVMGGKLTKYSGKYPGIIEEILLMMRAGKPVFIIGGFGGAAKAAVEAIQGNAPKELSEAFQFANNKNYKEYAHFFNTIKWTKTDEKIDYKKLTTFFQRQKDQKENAFGLNNGLSLEKNLRLFSSTDIYELISLILEGLFKIAQEKRIQ